MHSLDSVKLTQLTKPPTQYNCEVETQATKITKVLILLFFHKLCMQREKKQERKQNHEIRKQAESGKRVRNKTRLKSRFLYKIFSHFGSQVYWEHLAFPSFNKVSTLISFTFDSIICSMWHGLWQDPRGTWNSESSHAMLTYHYIMTSRTLIIAV